MINNSWPHFVNKNMLLETKKLCSFQSKELQNNVGLLIHRRSSSNGITVNARLLQSFIFPENKQSDGAMGSCADLHIVLFPSDSFPIAKEF